MALNIKSLKVEQLARELSLKTGKSLVGAVEEALRGRLEQLEREQVDVEKQRAKQRLVAIRKAQAQVKAVLGNGPLQVSKDEFDGLYE